MTWFLLVGALVAGAFLPLQAGINSQLRIYTGNSVIAAFISFVVGTIVLFGLALALRLHWPSSSGIAEAPWWVWIGGVLGAFFVYLTIVLADKLGAAVLISFIIAGQMAASLLLDQYGLIGYARHPITPGRLIGSVLLLAGVILIRYK